MPHILGVDDGLHEIKHGMLADILYAALLEKNTDNQSEVLWVKPSEKYSSIHTSFNNH